MCFPVFCQHTFSFDLFLFLLRFIWEGREGQYNIQNSFFTIALTTLLTKKIVFLLYIAIWDFGTLTLR